MPSGPVIAIAVLAKLHAVTARCMRRRLKKLDASHGGGLLFRFNDAEQAYYYVDLARLKQLAPAYAPLDPSAQVLERVTDIQKSVADIHSNLAALRDNVAAIMPRASL